MGDILNCSIYIKCAIIGIVTGIVNGLFGAGGGIIIIPFMVYLLKIDEHIAHATAISIILPLTVISSFFYIYNNFVDWNLVIKTSIGGIFGGYLGAKILKFIPTKYLKILFGIFMIFASIRMVIYS